MKGSLERKHKSGRRLFHKAAHFIEQMQTLHELKKKKKKRKTSGPAYKQKKIALPRTMQIMISAIKNLASVWWRDCPVSFLLWVYIFSSHWKGLQHRCQLWTPWGSCCSAAILETAAAALAVLQVYDIHILKELRCAYRWQLAGSRGPWDGPETAKVLKSMSNSTSSLSCDASTSQQNFQCFPGSRLRTM